MCKREYLKKGKQMSEYLSKEEIKQWRSSLERITLEEYAQRLGKVVKEEKRAQDVVDVAGREAAPPPNPPAQHVGPRGRLGRNAAAPRLRHAGVGPSQK